MNHFTEKLLLRRRIHRFWTCDQFLYLLCSWSLWIVVLRWKDVHLLSLTPEKKRVRNKLQLWAAADSSAGEAERSLFFPFCAVFLPPAGEEGDWGSFWESCWGSWERRRSTLWTRTESRTFFSSEEKRPRTWRSTVVFLVGRPIPTRSLGITCGQEDRTLTHMIYLRFCAIVICFQYLICTLYSHTYCISIFLCIQCRTSHHHVNSRLKLLTWKST